MARKLRNWRRPRSRRAMTLLELILALALSTFVIYAIGWAIHLHLRSLDVRSTSVEEAQLARALLKMVSDDLRSAVQHREQDFSGVEETLANALKAAAEELAMEGAALGLLEGTEAPPESPGGSEPPEGGEGGGRETGGGGTSGSGGTGGTGEPSGAGGEIGEEAFEEEPIDYTVDIADSGMMAPMVGLYGNSTQLQVDISRVPRADEVLSQQAALTQSAPPSDIKSIAYYVRSGLGPAGAGNAAGGMNSQPTAASGPFDPFGARTGLVRRVLNRSTAAYSSAAGAGGSRPNDPMAEQIVAPEVVDIQFEYFDGFEWTDSWDSMVMGGLPFAVVVQLTLLVDNRRDNYEMLEPEFMVFRQVISIPTAEPIPPEEVDENLEELMEEEGGL